MSLLSECVEVLGEDGYVLTKQEYEYVSSKFEQTFPITEWGRIDWKKIKVVHQVKTSKEITEIINNEAQRLDHEVYIIWDEASLPIIKSNLIKIESNIDDVTAVGFDTWLVGSNFNFVIEFFHDGIVRVGFTERAQKGQRGITERKPRKRGGKSKHRGISHEQVCVLVARDCTKATVSKVACMGRVLKTKVESMIGSKLTPNNVLVTDAWRAYKSYAKEKGIEHYRIKSNDGKHVIKGLYHIQNVNGLHSRMKQWIDRFKGVATKYLDNYLAWFLFVDSRSNESTKHNIKEFLLTSFVFEMTDTYDSLRLSKFRA